MDAPLLSLAFPDSPCHGTNHNNILLCRIGLCILSSTVIPQVMHTKSFNLHICIVHLYIICYFNNVIYFLSSQLYLHINLSFELTSEEVAFFLFFSVHERISISRKPWVISQWCWVILSISRNNTTTNNKSNVQYTLWKTEVGKLWTAQMFVQRLFMRVALSHF